MLFNVDETIAKKLLQEKEYPWEVIPEIEDFIKKLGAELSIENYDQVGKDIWIAKSAKIEKTACIKGPTIIDEGAEIRHCAFIRGSVIIGKNAIIGNSTELKNCILFNNVQVPHFNYVGDSILGYKAHFGAGAIASNCKADKGDIIVKYNNKEINTRLRKLGAIVGDEVEVGCNSVLNPGTIIEKNVIIYPLSCVRGYIQENSIYKSNENIIKRIET